RPVPGHVHRARPTERLVYAAEALDGPLDTLLRAHQRPEVAERSEVPRCGLHRGLPPGVRRVRLVDQPGDAVALDAHPCPVQSGEHARRYGRLNAPWSAERG